MSQIFQKLTIGKCYTVSKPIPYFIRDDNKTTYYNIDCLFLDKEQPIMYLGEEKYYFKTLKGSFLAYKVKRKQFVMMNFLYGIHEIIILPNHYEKIINL